MSEPDWLRRFVVANLNLWERGDGRGAAVADIAMATDVAPGDITAELELMRAEGLARCGDDGRWHPEVPGEHGAENDSAPAWAAKEDGGP